MKKMRHLFLGRVTYPSKDKKIPTLPPKNKLYDDGGQNISPTPSKGGLQRPLGAKPGVF